MVYSVYVSPSGNDNNPGTNSLPFKTLAAANKHLLDEKPQDNVAVILKSGVHTTASTVRWTYYNKKYFTTIIGESRTNSILDGNRLAKCLVIAIPNGQNTAIRIKNFTIRNCANAITVEGDTTNSTRWIGAVAITEMNFTNIGGKYADSTGYGAIRILNGSRCSVTFCDFKNIINTVRPELLHAIYLAHGSRNCTISDNVINTCTGDVFRVRDGSNYNSFSDNVIINSRMHSLFGDWFDQGDEKASFGNIVKNNTYSNSGLINIYTTVKAPEPRVRTAGNEKS